MVSLHWNKSIGPQTKILNLSPDVNPKTAIFNLLTFWVAYSHLIPISLYVIIEMLKLS